MQAPKFTWTQLGRDSKECLLLSPDGETIHLEADLKSWEMYTYVDSAKYVLNKGRVGNFRRRDLKAVRLAAEQAYINYLDTLTEQPDVAKQATTQAGSYDSSARPEGNFPHNAFRMLTTNVTSWLLIELVIVWLALQFLFSTNWTLFETLLNLLIVRFLFDAIGWRFVMSRFFFAKASVLLRWLARAGFRSLVRSFKREKKVLISTYQERVR